MALNIRQKLLVVIISSVVLTGVLITFAYIYVSTNQLEKEAFAKVSAANARIDAGFQHQISKLKKKYSGLLRRHTLTNELLKTTNTATIQPKLFAEMSKLAEASNLEKLAFYRLDKQDNGTQLLFYYSKKLQGNILVKDGQHQFYSHRGYANRAISNPALFPPALPRVKRSSLLIQNGQLVYQFWHPYYDLTSPQSVTKNQASSEHLIGYFNLHEKTPINFYRLGQELGVNFTIYNRRGHVLISMLRVGDLVRPFPNKESYFKFINENDSSFGSLIKPLVMAGEKVGYIHIYSANSLPASNIRNAIYSMIIVSLVVILIMIFFFSRMVGRFINPILELANASLAMATGDLERDIVENRTDELGMLARNFNNMRRAIKQQVSDLQNEIIERRNAQEHVQILSQAIEQSPVSVIITDSHGVIEYVNSCFELNTGFSVQETIGKRPKDLGSGINLGTRREEIHRMLQQGKTWEGEFESRKKNGEMFWERAHIAPVFDDSAVITHYLSVREDITLRKEQERHIFHQAHYDALTNLPNRFLALDRLGLQIKEAERSSKLVAVVFLDLDGFKKINDTLGHEVGDKLLIKAAERLRSVVRGPDTVARLGGDEFVILLGGLSAVSNVSAIAEKILDCLKKVFVIEGRELILTASAGIAIYPSDGDSVSELLRNADSAMYHSKELGRNTYSFFTRGMNEEVARQLAIEEQLHGALERSELTVVYQLQIEMTSQKIIGAEALLRWNNQILGQVSPAEFIPVAEQLGIIVKIGDFVVQQALEMVARWKQMFSADFRIAVNLSPRQFYELDLVENIERALLKSNVSSSNLELEITEGVLMGEHKSIEKALFELHDLGICIAMDDFGTGYSSLSYLRKYPFDVLKIDRSFVKDISKDAADRELISATIAMAHGLGLKVVAEGVETLQQFTFLKGQNCDYAQGYLFSKPVTEHELQTLAKKSLKTSQWF